MPPAVTIGELLTEAQQAQIAESIRSRESSEEAGTLDLIERTDHLGITDGFHRPYGGTHQLRLGEVHAEIIHFQK
jgi:hypothetical protein